MLFNKNIFLYLLVLINYKIIKHPNYFELKETYCSESQNFSDLQASPLSRFGALFLYTSASFGNSRQKSTCANLQKKKFIGRNS